MDTLSPRIVNPEPATRPTDAPCPFCPPPADYVLIERPLAFVKRDAHPLNKGRALVIPRRHVATFLDTTRCRPRAGGDPYKRNLDRFPDDFMFQLTAGEFSNLRGQSGTSSSRSQFVTSSWAGRRYLPYLFTKQRDSAS